MGGDYPVPVGWPSAAASSWQTRSTWASLIAGKKGSASEWARGGFGDRELALAVAELAQVREEVDAGQVGLAGDAALGQAGDRRVAVDLVAEADDVDEPAAPLLAAGGDRGLDALDPGQPLLVERGDARRAAPAASRASRPGRRRARRRGRRAGS